MVALASLCACSSQAPIAATEAVVALDTSPSTDAIAADTATPIEACESDAACATSLGPFSSCMRARCDLFSGLCVTQAQPDGLGCDDTDICTSNDICVAGVCTGGIQVECDDENPCTEDTCAGEAGCSFVNIEADCDDGDPCTAEDQCEDGACVSSTATDCDDGNSCTTDSCDLTLGCTHQARPGEPCDDEDACTSQSKCTPSGICGGLDPITCDDQDPCTKDICDSQLGCQAIQTNAPCDDNDACTENDVCVLGMCTGAPLICDDQDDCTLDECAPEEGCVHTGFLGKCDDQNPCTQDDTCGAEGLCTGVPVNCDDGNPCTFTSCDAVLGCLSVELQGAGCEDGDLCTVFDECIAGGVCVPGPAPSCDDSNICTNDTCEPSVGCVFTPFEGPCNDGNPCTDNEQCQQGFCAGSATDCDDGNPCTNDTCNFIGGCKHTTNTSGCDDESVCTQDDVCEGGVCEGVAIECDDQNPCTEDQCDPALGCKYSEVDDLSPCEDGDLCTLNETCLNGDCSPSGETPSCEDDDACTSMLCDPLIGCTYAMEAECLPPTAWPVINEVDYAQFGGDTSDFIELLIVGEGETVTDLYTIELLDGATELLYDLIHLSPIGENLVPGDRVVIGPPSIANNGNDNSYGIVVPGNFLQNGGAQGDAIRVMRNGDELIDSASYETIITGSNEGSTHIGVDATLVATPHSLGRCEDGNDTDENGMDFVSMPPSPGLSNICEP